jgi:hypothetical protein
MMAFKGFTVDLRSVMGDGKKKTCCFVPGETKKVERSKTANSGFHCCEYPPDCLRYYSWEKGRFFRVEAAGDIDEDEGERIAATEITLVEELDARKFAYYIMRYIAMYPRRKNWITNMTGVSIQPDKAKVSEVGHIAIARGSSPRVRGTEGSVVGLIVEKDEEIKNMKMLVVTSKYADKWLYIDKNRQLHVEEDV